MKKLLLLCAGLVTNFVILTNGIDDLREQEHLRKALQASQKREGYLWAGMSALSLGVVPIILVTGELLLDANNRGPVTDPSVVLRSKEMRTALAAIGALAAFSVYSGYQSYNRLTYIKDWPKE